MDDETKFKIAALNERFDIAKDRVEGFAEELQNAKAEAIQLSEKLRHLESSYASIRNWTTMVCIVVGGIFGFSVYQIPSKISGEVDEQLPQLVRDEVKEKLPTGVINAISENAKKADASLEHIKSVEKVATQGLSGQVEALTNNSLKLHRFPVFFHSEGASPEDIKKAPAGAYIAAIPSSKREKIFPPQEFGKEAIAVWWAPKSSNELDKWQDVSAFRYKNRITMYAKAPKDAGTLEGVVYVLSTDTPENMNPLVR